MESEEKKPNLSTYVGEMQKDVANVDRHNVVNLLRMEDGHLVSFTSLWLYVYYLHSTKWYTYGSGGWKGYKWTFISGISQQHKSIHTNICVLVLGGHFNILQGVWPCKPAVPRKDES